MDRPAIGTLGRAGGLAAAAFLAYAAGRAGYGIGAAGTGIAALTILFMVLNLRDSGRGRSGARPVDPAPAEGLLDATSLFSAALPEAGPREAPLIRRLAAGIAHEYNNALTAILGYSELTLERMRGNDPNRALVEEIRKAGARAAAATGNLVKYSRGQGGTPADAAADSAPRSAPGDKETVPGETVPGGLGPKPDGLGSGSTVLVVEDEESVRNLVRGVMEAHGYAVLEASGAREALYMHENHPGAIDVLLTDIVLSGKSGREVARDLSALRPGLRVIYMSGYADALIRSGLERGKDSFLRKPFSPARLLEAVRNALEPVPQSARAGV